MRLEVLNPLVEGCHEGCDAHEYYKEKMEMLDSTGDLIEDTEVNHACSVFVARRCQSLVRDVLDTRFVKSIN